MPKGTSVVILQPGGNDRRKLAPDRTPEIQARLAAMGIKVVMLPNGMLGGKPHQPDGQHLTPEGYRMLAEELAGQVAGALGLTARLEGSAVTPASIAWLHLHPWMRACARAVSGHGHRGQRIARFGAIAGVARSGVQDVGIGMVERGQAGLARRRPAQTRHWR